MPHDVNWSTNGRWRAAVDTASPEATLRSTPNTPRSSSPAEDRFEGRRQPARASGRSASEGWLASAVREFFGGWEPSPGVLGGCRTRAPVPPNEVALADRIDRSRLEAHVRFLAAPELGGRDNKTPGSAKARAYIESAFREIGLAPYFGDRYTQNIVLGDGTIHGTNVAGVLRANAPNPSGEYVMVVAHYDHVGTQAEGVFAGADDNASGVAALLEVARAISADGTTRNHDIVFVSPDCEEPRDVRTARMGSAYLIANSPRPVDALRLAVVLDVVGNGSLDGEAQSAQTSGTRRFMVLGGETSPNSCRLLKSLGNDPGTEAVRFSVAQAEKFVFPWQRRAKSDYFAVRERVRPFMFVSAGTSPRYHTPEDTPDTVDFEKIRSVARYVSRLTVAASRDTSPIEFDGDTVDPVADIDALALVIPSFLANPPAGLLEQHRKALVRDLEELRELRAECDRNGTLDPGEYHSLQGIAMDLQIAMTRPTQTAMGIAMDDFGHRIRRVFGLDGDG